MKMITGYLDDKFYKNVVVTDIPDKYVAIVLMLDSGHKQKLDQAHLQTVILAIG
jgi:hypothetical protein